MANKYTKWFVLGGIAFFILIILMWFGGSYNSLITMQESVDSSWAQVENKYQRRADLIPNLVETVKGSAEFQKSTLTEITEARSAWANAGSREEKIDAAKGLDSAISRLLLVAENYPQLDTSAYNTLMAQLEGTENRISVERGRYNEAVKAYNVKTKRVPTVFIARMFGFEEAEYFEVEEGKEAVPVVDF